jgi:Domain of unknown function (DUF397)
MSTDRVTPWQKATASGSNDSCFELRRNGARIELRDTKHRDGQILDDFTPAELAAFIDGAARGEFNHLL